MPKLHQIFDTNAYDRGRGHGLGPSIGKVGLGFLGVGFIDTDGLGPVIAYTQPLRSC